MRLGGMAIFRAFLAVVVTGLLVLPAAGQDTGGLGYEVEVSLVVVDVVVTDREGNHIRGLTKEDFVLYEDGVRQEITDFSEEGLPLTDETQMERDLTAAMEPEAPEQYPGRWFVLFFDQSNMHPAELDRARKAARDFVRYEIFPNDRVAVLSYGGSLKLEQDFTGDVDLLARTLYDEGYEGQREEGYAGQPLEQTVTLTTGTATGETQTPLGTASTDQFDRSLQNDTIRFQDSPDIDRLQRFQANERLYKALMLAGKTLAEIPGRKTIVFFSGGFDSVFNDAGLFGRYREMVNVLNSSNVAIYPVDTDGLAGKTPGSSVEGQRYRPGRAGLNTTTGSFRDLSLNQLDSLKVLAADTGGRALVGSNDLVGQLQEMAYSTSSYYLLGYVPDRQASQGFRDIKVKVKRPGARALARKGYIPQRDFEELSKSEKKQQLRDALLSWVDLSELPVQLRTEFYPIDVDRVLVGVELGIMRGLLQVSDEGAEAEIVMLMREEKGKDVSETREVVPLSAEDSLKDLRYVKSIETRPGTYWLKVVVRDNVNGLVGTTGARIFVPAFDDDRPILSSLVLMTPDTGTKLVTAEEDGGAVAESFSVGGRQFYPSPDNVFEADGEMVCFFRVTNLKLDAETQRPRMAVRYTIWRDDEPLSQQTVHYQALETPEPGVGIPIYVRVPAGGLGSGTYRLEVSAYDVLATKGMKSDVEFTLL